jgi:hypothetical protein
MLPLHHAHIWLWLTKKPPCPGPGGRLASALSLVAPPTADLLIGVVDGSPEGGHARQTVRREPHRLD